LWSIGMAILRWRLLVHLGAQKKGGVFRRR
jgi:hypothetical protein